MSVVYEMRKVLVIGSSGAGKSTFARRLGEVSGLPVIHLDRLFWNADWVETPKDQWRERVADVLKGESWIIDGNYGGTMEMRLEACDTVIFLDLPALVCTWSVLKRVILYREDTRPDMANGCPERFDWEFLKWTWNYPVRSRPGVEERLAKVRDRKRIITLRSRREMEDFLVAASAENAIYEI
jgi:adenylate kinase family enzyme